MTPEDISILHAHNCFFTHHDVAGCLAAACRHIEEYPDDYRGWHYRGNMEKEQKEYEKSLESFTRALALYNEEPLVWIHRGEAHMGLTHNHAAFSDFSHAVALDPTDPFFTIKVAGALCALEDEAYAHQKLDAAIAQHPSTSLYAMKAIVYAFFDEFAAADETLERIADTDTDPIAIQARILIADWRQDEEVPVPATIL
jgi:tetratricopeptide (TPR) repeat protein